MTMAKDAQSPATESLSVLKSTLITPIEVQTSSNPGMTWHGFSEPESYPALSSSNSSSAVPQVAQNSGPGPIAVFHTEFHAMGLDNRERSFSNALDPTRHRDSLSSSSGSSFSDPSSPISSTLSGSPTKLATFPADTEADGDDAPWNLVAYHIPWGSAYDGYKAGTLPGPEGTCIFLRSPTPTKRQRTSQACDKCRERKAKCSGSRPSCARCHSRGHACNYSPSPSSDAQPVSSRSSSLLRTSKSRTNSRYELHRLKGPTLNRVRRKSSLGGSESSLGSGSVRDRSPGIEECPDATAISYEYYGDQNYEFSSTTARSFFPDGDDSLSIQQLSPLSPSVSSPSSDAASFHSGSLPQGFSGVFRTRGHTFSGGTATPLYANSLSGLDAYRFPTLPLHVEDVKDIAIVHPQPQILRERASMPQLSYSLSPLRISDTEIPSERPGWYGSGEMDAVWEDTTEGGMVPGLQYPQPHPTTSSSSLFPSPHSYAGSFEHPDTYTPASYEVPSDASVHHPNFELFPCGSSDGYSTMQRISAWTNEKNQAGPDINVVEPDMF